MSRNVSIPPVSAGGGASGNPAPGPNRVPQSLGSGLLDSGWMPAAVVTAQQWCHPSGNDNARGDEMRPVRTVKRAWENLYTVGGGTLCAVDGSPETADGRGLFIGYKYALPSNGVRPMNVHVVGKAGQNGRTFTATPQAFLTGGSGSLIEQDDPAIWLGYNPGHPMTFENIFVQANKPWRMGWDYAKRDPVTGAIIKPNVLHATRDGNETLLTLAPYEWPIQKITRTGNLVEVIVEVAPGQSMEVAQGCTVYVDYTGDPNFTSGFFTAGTFILAEGQFRGFHIDVSALPAFGGGPMPGGSFGPVGVIGGPAIGTAETTSLLPGYRLTLDSTNAEFPQTFYQVLSIDPGSHEVIIADPYGYGPRSPSADEADIGVYATQIRTPGNNTPKVNFKNIGGQTFVGPEDLFVRGPGMDVGVMFFSEMSGIYVDGYNLGSSGGEWIVRDLDRASSLLFLGGYGGLLEKHHSSAGGVRIHGDGPNIGNMTIRGVVTDVPIGELAQPALEFVSGISGSHRYWVEDVSTADAAGDVIAIKITEDADPLCIAVVNGASGRVSGPCHEIHPGRPSAANTEPPPNYQRKAGYYSSYRIIAGRHLGGNRAVAALTQWASVGVSQVPGGWTVTNATISPTPRRDPFGGNRAYRVTGTTDGGSVRFVNANVGGVAAPGDWFAAAIWARGENASFPHLFALSVGPSGAYLNKLGFPARNGGQYGEWSIVTAFGRLSASATGEPTCMFELGIQTGRVVDIFMPSLFRCSQADLTAIPVTDYDLAEIETNLVPVPGYLQAGHVGTPEGVPFIGHGGLGSGLAYVEGASAGQLTIVGSFSPKKYEPVLAANGAIKGWVELINATVNP